jgi:hypothetical protein
MTTRRHAHLWLALLFLCGQLALAWHAPSHIVSDHDGNPSVLAASDCDICLPSQGAAPLPQATSDLPQRTPDIPRTFTSVRIGLDTTVPGAGPRAPPVLS